MRFEKFIYRYVMMSNPNVLRTDLNGTRTTSTYAIQNERPSPFQKIYSCTPKRLPVIVIIIVITRQFNETTPSSDYNAKRNHDAFSLSLPSGETLSFIGHHPQRLQ